jgi:hypothetical protein
MVELIRIGCCRRDLRGALNSMIHTGHPVLRPVLKIVAWNDDALSAFSSLFDAEDARRKVVTLQALASSEFRALMGS